MGVGERRTGEKGGEGEVENAPKHVCGSWGAKNKKRREGGSGLDGGQSSERARARARAAAEEEVDDEEVAAAMKRRRPPWLGRSRVARSRRAPAGRSAARPRLNAEETSTPKKRTGICMDPRRP